MNEREPLTDEQQLANVRDSIAFWASQQQPEAASGSCDACEVVGYSALHDVFLRAVVAEVGADKLSALDMRTVRNWLMSTIREMYAADVAEAVITAFCGFESAWLKAEVAKRLASGWAHMTQRAGMLKRCERHQELLHPWVADIDPVRVRDWLAAERVKQSGGAFVLDFEDMRRVCA